MIAYAISLIMLILAIWHDRHQDFPDLDAALDELPDFDFDKNWWISSDNSTAMAIDSKQHKICLLRAYKGLQVIDYRQLLEYELEQKPVEPPAAGINNFLYSFIKPKSDCTKVALTLLLDDLNQFDFTLTLYVGCSVKKIKQTKPQANKILKILKIVQKRAEKQEKLEAFRYSVEEEDYDSEELLEIEPSHGSQTEFDFEPA